jgi:shikimate kinase
MKIVVTGPRSVGKSTVSRLLAESLQLVCVSSDELLDQRLSAFGGLEAAMKNGPAQPIVDEGIALVRDTMARPDSLVFDLAGGAIGDPVTRAPVLSSLEGALVIGLIPSEDDTESIDFLLKRERERAHFQGVDEQALRAKVEHDYQRLQEPLSRCAHRILMTGSKSAHEIAEEIVVAVRSA